MSENQRHGIAEGITAGLLVAYGACGADVFQDQDGLFDALEEAVASLGMEGETARRVTETALNLDAFEALRADVVASFEDRQEAGRRDVRR